MLKGMLTTEQYKTKQKLKSESYYLDKLSMFLRNSPGVPEHFSMMISMLNIVDEVLDNILYFFDITKDEVFLKIEEMGTSSDILDKIAHLYGVRRHFTVTYVEDSETISRELTLNNFELWTLIKAQILQNCYDGSFKQMREFYDKMRIPVYVFSSTSSGNVSLLLDMSSSMTVGTKSYSFADNPNIEYLFKANMFTIRSMGIRYFTSTMSVASVAIWDDTSEARSWDNAKWGL